LRTWKPWRRLLKLSSASPGVGGLALYACPTGAIVLRSGCLASAIAIARKARIGRVGVWRGGVRLSISVCRPFRLAVP
jgi:hypothetical protein